VKLSAETGRGLRFAVTVLAAAEWPTWRRWLGRGFEDIERWSGRHVQTRSVSDAAAEPALRTSWTHAIFTQHNKYLVAYSVILNY